MSLQKSDKRLKNQDYQVDLTASVTFDKYLFGDNFLSGFTVFSSYNFVKLNHAEVFKSIL